VNVAQQLDRTDELEQARLDAAAGGA
jgi:hypothetical protein